MSLGEYLTFAIHFGFLFLVIIMAYQGTIAPEKVLGSRWGKTIRRKTSAKQLKKICTLLLVGGLLLLGFTIRQLANGTFQLRGNPKSYGFSDFLK